MTDPTILGNLNNLYEMQSQLVEPLPERDAASQYIPQLGSLNWLLGRGVYLELYWLRQVIAGDADLSQRVERLFAPGELTLHEQCAELPPKNHLLNWAADIRDEHLMRLANPNTLPKHELLEDDRLQWFLLQEQASLYESMLLVLNQRSLKIATDGYRVDAPLSPSAPEWQTKELSQGHYRIGARNDPRAYDNERPPQAVELSSYRIALTPVSNSQFLGFMQAGGYSSPGLWTEDGLAWQTSAQARHPEYWRQDETGNWYGIGINGPSYLPPDEPVSGINQYEAQAFANWAGSQKEEFAGAILQHEYQWEVAARTGVIQQSGRAWEWCGNNFHPYPEFTPFPDENASSRDFDERHISLRGGSFHTQRLLRRASYRHRALPDQRFQLSGLRLVFPPKHEWS